MAGFLYEHCLHGMVVRHCTTSFLRRANAGENRLSDKPKERQRRRLQHNVSNELFLPTNRAQNAKSSRGHLRPVPCKQSQTEGPERFILLSDQQQFSIIRTQEKCGNN